MSPVSNNNPVPITPNGGTVPNGGVGDTILVEGTRRSVYFATSMDAPIESSDLLCVP